MRIKVKHKQKIPQKNSEDLSPRDGPIYYDDPKTGGRVFLPASSVYVNTGGVQCRIAVIEQVDVGIRIYWGEGAGGLGEVAFIPTGYQQAMLKSKERMK